MKQFSHISDIQQIKASFISLFMTMFLFSAQSQSLAVTAGGESTSDAGSVSYTIGQVFYHQYNNLNDGYKIHEGLQQVNLEQLLDLVIPKYASSINVSVFPNPTTDYVHVNLGDVNMNSTEVNFQVIDSRGAIVKSGQFNEVESQIMMSDLRADVYFIRVTQKNLPSEIIKLVKI